MSPFQSLTARLVRSVSLSRFTNHLDFEIPREKRFGFVAGQWLSFRQPNTDGEEITRAYSICSPPSDDNRFALCLNRVQGGFMSNFLCDMKEGEQVSLQGPFGDFILRPPISDTIFIATGTGIAPFRSMLQWLFADRVRHQEKQFWLLFGNRHERDIYYYDEFLALACQHSNFHYLPTLSRPDEKWRGMRGYVQQHVPDIAQDRPDMHAYICGLDKMVKANRELLKSLGWDKKRIRHEKYD
jgi:ferredoxin-NADP reductase